MTKKCGYFLIFTIDFKTAKTTENVDWEVPLKVKVMKGVVDSDMAY